VRSGRERNNDVEGGRNVTAPERQCLITMNVTMTGAALLVHDALQALATATLALPILAATAIVTTVDILRTLRAEIDIVAVAQIPITDDGNGITALTTVVIALLIRAGLNGRARTSLIPTRTASDRTEVAVALLMEEYGMMMTVAHASAIAAIRPRSVPPNFKSVRVPTHHHPNHRSPRALARIVQHA
jgi:hypothetical protein